LLIYDTISNIFAFEDVFDILLLK